MDLKACYTLLEVEQHCSAEELKAAYKRKAKYWHPDKNKSEQAHDMFIQISEAYAILENLQGKDPLQSIKWDYDAWKSTEQFKFRQALKDQLKMSYREFLQTQITEDSQAIEQVVTHMIFMYACCSVIILPIILCVSYGISGLFMAIFWNCLSIIITSSAVRNLHELNARMFLKSLGILINKRSVVLGTLIVSSILVTAIYTIKTVDQLSYAIGSILLALLCTLLVLSWKKKVL